MGKSILISILCLWAGMAYSQIELPGSEDKIYDENIRSLRLTLESSEFALPILPWQSSQRLLLRFDDMSYDPRNLYYTLVHCDQDWQPSRLFPNEYLDGFEEEEMINYEFSQLSYEEFVHYRLTFPNARTRWLLPGNYILYVYDEKPDNPCFTKRFVVVDNQMGITAEIRRCPKSGKMLTHQCLEFEVTNKNFDVVTPSMHIKAYAMQNGDWNTLQEVPMRGFRQGELDVYSYDLPSKAAFEGLIEYYPVDTRSINGALNGVQFIERDDIGPILYTPVRYPYAGIDWENYLDLNGRYIVANWDQPPPMTWDSTSEQTALHLETFSEYIRVHFSLEMPEINQPVHVVGSFCQFDRKDWNRMQYDDENKAYRATLWLKQGYYDYQFMRWDEQEQDLKYVGNSSYQTENDYQILIYHRGFNDRYDRPVAFRIVDIQ